MFYQIFTYSKLIKVRLNKSNRYSLSSDESDFNSKVRENLKLDERLLTLKCNYNSLKICGALWA